MGAKRLEIRRLPRVRRRLLLRRSTRRRRKITRRRRRKRSKLKASPNFHHHLLGLKSKSYPCNKRHSMGYCFHTKRIPAGRPPPSRGTPQSAICDRDLPETRQVPVRICYALKIR